MQTFAESTDTIDNVESKPQHKKVKSQKICNGKRITRIYHIENVPDVLVTENFVNPPGNKDLLRLEHIDSSSTTAAKVLRIYRETAKPNDKDKHKEKKQRKAEDFLQTLGESSVLNRVRAFLPILEESNKKLTMDIKEKGADGFNIEVLKGDEHTPYVEMDLALGVANLCTPDAVSAAERLVGGQASMVETSADSDLDSEHSDAEKDDEKKILPSMRTKRPKIEALS